MFDLDNFLADCRAAVGESESPRALREVMTRAVRDGDDVATALRPEKAGITLLHHGSDLTVLHVVWAPHMTVYPHDHRMWAAIGVYTGQEDNAFFRRAGDDGHRLVDSGGKQLRDGDVIVLGDDTIHSVTNPADRLTGAIHVYGGDFVRESRSQWAPPAYEEAPYDLAATMREFEDANRAWLGDS